MGGQPYAVGLGVVNVLDGKGVPPIVRRWPSLDGLGAPPLVYSGQLLAMIELRTLGGLGLHDAKGRELRVILSMGAFDPTQATDTMLLPRVE